MTAVGTAYVPIQPDFKAFNKATNSQAKAAGKRIAKAIGGALVVGGAISEAKKSINLVKTLAKDTKALSRVTGMDERQSSRWIATMRARGVEAGKLQVSFTALSRQILAAQNGSEAAIGVFNDLGVSLDTIERGNTQEVLGDISDAFAKMPDGPKKTAFAAKLFGRSFKDLFPIINDGKASMEDALAVADKYGNTLSKKQVKAALLAVKAQREFGMATDGLRIQLGSALMPAITSAAAGAAQFVSDLRSGEGPIGRVGKAVGAFARDLKSLVVPAVKAIRDGIASLPGPIKSVAAVAAGLGLVFAATGPVGLAVAAIAGGAVLIKRNWETIGPIFDSVANAVKSAFGVASEWVQQAIGNVVRWLDLGGGKAGDFSKAISNVFNLAKTAVQTFAKVYAWVFTSIVLPVVKRVLPGVQQIVKGFVTQIGGIIKVFSGIFTGDFGKAFEGVKQIFKGQFIALFGIVRAATAPLRQVVSKLFRTFVSAVKGTGKALYSAGKFVVTKLVDGAGAAGKLLLNIGKKLGGKLKEAFLGAVSGIGKAVRSVFSGIVSVIKAPINAVVRFVNKLIRAFNKIPGHKDMNELGTFARGGYIGGRGLRDTQLIAAAPGEAVLNRHQQREVNSALAETGRGNLSAVFRRNRTPHYRGDGKADPVGAGGVDTPQFFTRGGYVRYKRMLGRAVGISHKRMKYQYGGFGNPSYDCSGYVSAILGAGGFMSGRTDTNGLRRILAKGAGRFVTVGVRGGAGRTGHTMMAMRNTGGRWRYFEAGRRGPVGEYGSWNGGFDWYHPRGDGVLAKPGSKLARTQGKKVRKKIPKLSLQERRDNRLAKFAFDLADAETNDDEKDPASYEDNRSVLEARVKYVSAIVTKLRKKIASITKRLKTVNKALASKSIKRATRVRLSRERVKLTLQGTKAYEDLTGYLGMVTTDNSTIAGFGSNVNSGSDQSSDLLRQINSQLQDQLRLQSAQLPVFERMGALPYAGSYHDGGQVAGRRGQEVQATLLGGETVLPIGAGSEPLAVIVDVHVHDEAVDSSKIETTARLVYANETRRASRRARSGPMVGRRAAA